MAHSIQTIGDNFSIINDRDLEVLVAILCEEIASSEEKYSSLNLFAKQFVESVVNSGPGCIDLELEKIRSDSLAMLQFAGLLSAIEEKVSDWNENISESIVSEEFRFSGLRFTDYPTSKVFLSVEKIRSLFEE